MDYEFLISSVSCSPVIHAFVFRWRRFLTLEEQINDLVDAHNKLWSYEDSGLVRKDRTIYMRYLIESELAERGHSLKGLRLK